VTNDFESRWHFNTTVALIMELVNELQAQELLDIEMSPAALKKVFAMLILMLSPIAPHISEELWEMLGFAGGLSAAKWPAYSDDLAREEQVEIIIQINGRMRGKILVDADLGEAEALDLAGKDPRIAELMAGKQIVKTIVVPNKLVNIVLK
jgi:leucyl-tRNA synthetase